MATRDLTADRTKAETTASEGGERPRFCPQCGSDVQRAGTQPGWECCKSACLWCITDTDFMAALPAKREGVEGRVTEPGDLLYGRPRCTNHPGSNVANRCVLEENHARRGLMCRWGSDIIARPDQNRGIEPVVENQPPQLVGWTLRRNPEACGWMYYRGSKDEGQYQDVCIYDNEIERHGIEHMLTNRFAHVGGASKSCTCLSPAQASRLHVNGRCQNCGGYSGEPPVTEGAKIEQAAWEDYASGRKTLKEAVAGAFKALGESVLRDEIARIIMECIGRRPETHSEELDRKLRARVLEVHGEKDVADENWPQG